MTLLQMSLSGAVLVAVILVLRAALLYRLPKRTFAALWWVALARLLAPFSVPSVTSIYSLLARLRPGAEVQGPLSVAAVPAASVPSKAAVPAVQAAEAMPAAVQAAGRAFPWELLWLAGALACALALAAAYGRCCREFRTALPVEQEAVEHWKQTHPLRRPLDIRQSDRIDAPLTYGIFRPVILLPKSTDWSDRERLDYVLLHEYIHIRRWDAAAKLAAAAALCLHWFNPMVWVLYTLFNRDIELACDEAVLRRQDGDKRADYARTLIDLEARKSGLMPLCSSFGKDANEERITAIMKTRKGTVFAAVAACVLVVAVAGVFATSGKREEAPRPAVEASTIASRQQTGTIRYKYGNTAFLLTVQEFKDRIPAEHIVWWSYEDYQKYVEQKRAKAEKMVKEQRWSEKTAENYLTPYEQNLKALEAGYMLTRWSEGNEVSILYTPEEYQKERDTTQYSYVITPYSGAQCIGAYQFIFDIEQMEKDNLALRQKLWDEALAPYAAFGVTWEWEGKWRFYRMYYQGQEVRCIYDDTAGTCISEGATREAVYYRDNVDLYAVYQDGQLAGVRLATEEEQQAWPETWPRLKMQATQAIEAIEKERA